MYDSRDAVSGAWLFRLWLLGPRLANKDDGGGQKVMLRPSATSIEMFFFPWRLHANGHS